MTHKNLVCRLRHAATGSVVLLLACCAQASVRQARPATIIEPNPGVFVAAADYSFYNYKDYSHVTQRSPTDRIKKTLDLTDLSEQDFASIESATVSIFIHVQDGAGDGLDETFDVVVNGHSNTFPTENLASTGWGWFDTRLAINWFDFDISGEELVHGANEIVIHLSPNSSKDDDQLVIGIDMFEDQGCSARSTDAGATWMPRPLNKAGFSGEYMVRLVLLDRDADKENLSFSHENFPALPAVDMAPAIKPLPAAPDEPPRLVEGDDSDSFENGAMRVELRHRDGIALEKLVHKSMQADAMREPMKQNLFALEVDGERLTGPDFSVLRKEIIESTPERLVVVYDLSNDAAQISGRLRVTMDRSEELLIGLSIQNRADQNRVIKAAFPVLGGLGWSDGFVEDRYLYPYGTGVVLDHPGRFNSGYGGGGTYFQQMASFNPSQGGGLYLRVNDQTGEYKILHLLKADRNEDDPTFMINPILSDGHHGRAPYELILWEPFEKTMGTSMAFSYFGRDMEPDERWRFASATLGVMNSDWRVAMNAYRKWFEGFSHKNRYPNTMTKIFNYASTGPEWGYRGPGDKEAYNPDPTVWGHKVMGHVSDDFMTKIVGGLEHSGYWEHEEITDEMMARNKATAAKYGLTFELFPSRYGMLEGKYVLWGNQGDYGLQGYNERWGGLPTFRKYIADLKARGYIATLYINKAEAGFDTLLGKAHGPDWATMYPEGHYFWPYYDWQMCMDHAPWRTYLAETCARLIEETGADGVRIDEMGGAARICLNKKHPHTFARWRHYNELQAQSDAARQVRRAMDGVNPNSVLLSESQGIDVLGQYLDASLCYDLTEQPFTAHVAANWEGFVGINIHHFYFPRHKMFDYQISLKQPEWRFFNATGAFNREWCYREHQRHILRDNSDAFGSLDREPMIRSKIPLVYVNKFPAKDKTVWTVYNAANIPAKGALLDIPARKGTHLVDLYRYRNVKASTRGDKTVVAIELEPRSVTCIAQLPKLMDARSKGPELSVRLKHDLPRAEVRVTDGGGTTVAEGAVENRACRLSIPPDAGPLICKLYREGSLVDATPLP